jgi:GNAT superfamily N-acetyltransferase
MDLYNAAWDKNWGFVPVTPAEARAIEKMLRPMIDPQLVTFVYHESEPIGVGFALPDWNVVLRRLGGRLGPFRLLKALLQRRRIRGLRGFIFGVKEEYRGLGIPFLAFEHVYRRWRNRYQYMELGWILEDNFPLLQLLEEGGLRPYRRYRIYQKAIN